MKTDERPSRRSNCGLPIVLLSARVPTPGPRHGNLKACLHATMTWLATSLVDLLLDIILRFTTDKDDPLPVSAPIGQRHDGGRYA
jgi:hypothetical protein